MCESSRDPSLKCQPACSIPKRLFSQIASWRPLSLFSTSWRNQVLGCIPQGGQAPMRDGIKTVPTPRACFCLVPKSQDRLKGKRETESVLHLDDVPVQQFPVEFGFSCDVQRRFSVAPGDTWFCCVYSMWHQSRGGTWYEIDPPKTTSGGLSPERYDRLTWSYPRVK